MKSKNVLRWLSCVVLAGSMSQAVQAEGWNLGGYVKTGFSVDSDLKQAKDLQKGDFFLGTASTTPANQVELTGNRRFEAENGAAGTLFLRAEYGNGTDYENYLYSSSGGEGENGPVFEVKEAFIEMEKLDFLPEEAKVWAGRRFYGRASSAGSGEFWKQTSGVGVGYDTGKFAVAFVGVDTNKAAQDGRVFVLDNRVKDIKVPGGSLEVQFNYYMHQKMENAGDKAENGFGIGLTYNINGWYGLNGWSQAGLAYGTGIGGTAKGLNFGDWVVGADKDATSIYATTYGVWNVNDKLQMGTEISLHKGEELYGQKEITRLGFSATPSYKVGENLRLTAEATVGMQTLDNPGAWGRDKKTETRMAITLAPVMTINNDYYGRPQIKPFVTFASTSDNKQSISNDGKKSGTFFGVQAEVWF